MKKTFLLAAALLILGSSAFAGGGYDLAIGPKIGYQTAMLSYKKADIKAGFANNFTLGLFGRVSFNRLYIQPEVLYFKTSNIFDVNVVGTGAQNWLNIPTTGTEVNLTLNTMNLQVPVIIGFTIIDVGPVALRAQVGPTANFILQSKTLVDYTINGTSNSLEVDEDKSFDTKSISWGMQAGVGVDLFKRLTLDINYNFGISKVFNELNDTALGSYFDFDNIDNTRQNLFMVTIGYKLL